MITVTALLDWGAFLLYNDFVTNKSHETLDAW